MADVPFADRPLPAWFDEAKFGIFIHWGPYAVPCYAPVHHDMGQLFAAGNWEEVFRNSPYTEWYLNSMALEGSPTAQHHAAHYPSGTYADFVTEFAERCRAADVGAWASLFSAAGARYVVPITKHHDGYLMWDGDNDGRFDYVTTLAAECRANGIRVGTYYSGGIDWRFNPPPIRSLVELMTAVPTSDEYAALVTRHIDDLIDRFHPDVLWNDIGWPPSLDPNDTFDHYYAAVPDGAVNDRFDMAKVRKGLLHCDFTTPEYSTTPRGTRKWEVCRGIGRSFGYNRMETDETLLSPDNLIWMLCDIVGRGGNLLLNVGPTADGQIPLAQATRLQAMGWWLRVNGEAIYDTRPVGSTRTADGRQVRLTARRSPEPMTYAMVAGAPANDVTFENVTVPNGATVTMLGSPRVLSHTMRNGELRVKLPDHLPDSPATVFAITGDAVLTASP
jgi:alpha-L-fucosidase